MNIAAMKAQRQNFVADIMHLKPSKIGEKRLNNLEVREKVVPLQTRRSKEK